MEVIVTLVCQHESCLKAFRLPNHRRIWIKLNDRGRILGRKAKAARLGMARMRGAFHENGWWWNRRCEFRAMNRIMFGSISLSQTMLMIRKAGPRILSAVLCGPRPEGGTPAAATDRGWIGPRGLRSLRRPAPADARATRLVERRWRALRARRWGPSFPSAAARLCKRECPQGTREWPQGLSFTYNVNNSNLGRLNFK